MGLLNKIKTKVQNKHPLVDEDFETKINYLNAVAFFMAIDDDVNDNEREVFSELIFLLKCEEFKDDLNSFLENPNVDEFENIFDSIKESNYFWIFIMEIAFVEERIELKPEEMEFFKIILDIKKYELQDILDVISFSKNCFHNDSMLDTIARTLLSNKRLSNYKEQIINFYKLNKNIKEKLLTISNELKDTNIMILKSQFDSIQTRINDLKKVKNLIIETRPTVSNKMSSLYTPNMEADTLSNSRSPFYDILNKEIDILKEEANTLTERIKIVTQ